jgi:ribosomal protein S18 acetylase RimI-like enzyme
MIAVDASKVALREQTDGDMEFLLALYISTRESEMINVGWAQHQIDIFLKQQFETQTLWYRNLYPNAEYQIVEFEGEPVGRFYLIRTENEIRLIDLALLPEFRGKKLGAYLIREITQAATAKGILVSLHVEYRNPAIRLYHRLGFEVVEDLGIYLLMQWYPEGLARPR